jgi:hypothetical protein
MKEILIALFLGFTFIQAPDGYIYAQNSRKIIEPSLKKNFIPSVRYLNTLMYPDPGSTYMLQRNEINFRALRDFMSRYESEDQACWFSTPGGGFESYFVKDGYGNRVIYDKNGNWSYSLINYGEDKLSVSIRNIIKSEYYDLAIVLVEEVQMNGGTEYIFTLEDISEIRVVKLNHWGELEDLQELKRQLPD